MLNDARKPTRSATGKPPDVKSVTRPAAKHSPHEMRRLAWDLRPDGRGPKPGHYMRASRRCQLLTAWARLTVLTEHRARAPRIASALAARAMVALDGRDPVLMGATVSSSVTAGSSAPAPGSTRVSSVIVTRREPRPVSPGRGSHHHPSRAWPGPGLSAGHPGRDCLSPQDHEDGAAVPMTAWSRASWMRSA